MPQIDWNSSLIEAAAYQDQWSLLELAFRSGAVYHYFAVPAQTYQELLRAESKGVFSTPISGIASPTSRSILRASAVKFPPRPTRRRNDFVAYVDTPPMMQHPPAA